MLHVPWPCTIVKAIIHDKFQFLHVPGYLLDKIWHALLLSGPACGSRWLRSGSLFLYCSEFVWHMHCWTDIHAVHNFVFLSQILTLTCNLIKQQSSCCCMDPVMHLCGYVHVHNMYSNNMCKFVTFACSACMCVFHQVYTTQNYIHVGECRSSWQVYQPSHWDQRFSPSSSWHFGIGFGSQVSVYAVWVLITTQG